MKRFLPDVNLVLALLDPMHVHHEAAHQWYGDEVPKVLLLCPLVENGVIRVASQPRYPNCMGTSARVREIMQVFRNQVAHESVARDVSLLDDEILLKPEALAPSRVSDLYLLALAVANDGRFATFDQRIPAEAVRGGDAGLEVVGI
ncbi:MAG: PIN domain-containing protein [Verrucomicrobiota bacterium]